MNTRAPRIVSAILLFAPWPALAAVYRGKHWPPGTDIRWSGRCHIFTEDTVERGVSGWRVVKSTIDQADLDNEFCLPFYLPSL